MQSQSRKPFDASARISHFARMASLQNTTSIQPIDINLSTLWSSITIWIARHWGAILSALVIGFGIVATLYLVKLLGQWLCRPGRWNGHYWPSIIGKTLSRTHVWFMIAVAAQIICALAFAPPQIALPARIAFVCATGFQVAIWVRALVLGIVQYRAREADPSGSLGSAVGIIRLLVTVGLFLFASIFILSNLGVNVSGILAGLGIGGIAIGLAAQGIFSDLFAALSILFDKPFRKGDLIRWETTTGTVEAIGLKTSRIRALSGEEIIISNANLLSKELRNFERLEKRRINQTLSLVFNTPVDTCEAMAALLEPAINACAGCSFVRTGLETFGASSLDFALVYDIVASDQNDILVCRNAANLAVMRVFAREGIAFAYPTQTTYTAAPDGKLVMPWATPPKK
jgi:small-conductance mechanosensitive channel